MNEMGECYELNVDEVMAVFMRVKGGYPHHIPLSYNNCTSHKQHTSFPFGISLTSACQYIRILLVRKPT